MAGLITVTLQIAYLPHLYAAFNRRENEIALLNSRAGMPSWGPELLARTHYALGSGTSALDTLPEFYSQWERWAADVTESHVTYSPLAWFRSPSHEASWATALLSVLDSAALYLALCPGRAPAVPTRLCLRSGMVCFGEVARSMGLAVPAEPDPEAGISLGYDEFLDAVARLQRGRLPDRARAGGRLAALRRLAGQLRAGRVRDRRGDRRRPRALVRPAPPAGSADTAAAPRARPAVLTATPRQSARRGQGVTIAKVGSGWSVNPAMMSKTLRVPPRTAPRRCPRPPASPAAAGG